MSANRPSERAHLAEERMRLLVDSIRDYAVFMLRSDGVIETWNAAAQTLTGYSPNEMIGKHLSSLYPPQAESKRGAPLAIAEREGRFEEETWLVRKGGSHFWTNLDIAAIRNAGGDLLGFATVFRDLTERRMWEEQLHRSEERFRLLVRSVKDYAIFMLDTDGRIVTWNEGAEQIKGYRSEEIIGAHMSRFYTEEDLATDRPGMLLRSAAANGRVEDEGWRVRKDGSRFWADVIVTAVHDHQDRLIGYAKVTRDLTQRRQHEEERLQLAQAREGIRVREDFLSIVAHELRTPLTALQLQLEALSARADQTNEPVTRLAGRALRSGANLAALIESLLDTTRMARGDLTLTPHQFDLVEAVHAVVERLHDLASSAGCEISVRGTRSLRGTWDRLRIEQALTNVVSNAIKYASGKPIEVLVGGDGSQALLEIHDEGPGIPASALSRIFDRFERATSSRHYGGMGLGLYVTRQIVEAHGGRVTADNLPGGGTSISMRLPLHRDASAASPSEGAL